NPRLDTVFIGGGTPSRVPAGHIAMAMDAVREHFALAPDAEVTIEANPQSAAAAKMEGWLRSGVNRLSLGFQSLDQTALAFLEVAMTVLGAAGFEQYETSNCARPGRRCRHNEAYWTGVPYAAAGAGAHAYLLAGAHPAWLGGAAGVGVRQWNMANPAAYVTAV